MCPRAGSFMDTLRKQEEEQANMAEQLTVRQDKDASSHTAGFEVGRLNYIDSDIISSSN